LDAPLTELLRDDVGELDGLRCGLEDGDSDTAGFAGIAGALGTKTDG
jgi:hypothetical protein